MADVATTRSLRGTKTSIRVGPSHGTVCCQVATGPGCALEGRTKAYASGIGYCLSDDELFAFYRRMAERGVDGGKLKIGLDLTADFHHLTKQGNATKGTREAWDIVLEVLAERGL